MFKRILLAVDGSQHSERAIEVASDVARSSGAEVVVFHVQEKIPTPTGSYVARISGEEEVAIADVTAKRLKSEGVNATFEETSAFYGFAAREIVSAASAHDADLIVMGSRGLSDLEGLVIGSATRCSTLRILPS
jgi:nucleotide-binding universal stress UspA family protein